MESVCQASCWRLTEGICQVPDITQLASVPLWTEPHGRNAASENISTGAGSQEDASYAQSGPQTNPDQMAVTPSGGNWPVTCEDVDVGRAELVARRPPAGVAQLQQITPAPAIADGAECDNNLTYRKVRYSFYTLGYLKTLIYPVQCDALAPCSACSEKQLPCSNAPLQPDPKPAMEMNFQAFREEHVGEDERTSGFSLMLEMPDEELKMSDEELEAWLKMPDEELKISDEELEAWLKMPDEELEAFVLSVPVDD